MQLLKIFSWMGYIAGAICLMALLAEENMSFLAPAIGAIASGAIFAALDIVIIELKGIRSAISGESIEQARETKVDTIAPDAAPAPTRSIQEIDADIKRMKDRLKP
ncbi:MAG: hypothetical protein ACI8Q6_001848 [Granulosicoccus sp.]